MSDDKRAGDKPTSGLLGDLESIRSLLDDREEAGEDDAEEAGGNDAEEAGEDDAEVPLLEDVVHGGVSVNESFLSGEGDFIETAGASGLNEEIFKALLSDEWREAARELLDEARAAIEQHQSEWTPKHTDELNETLKVRIDDTVQGWLRQVVHSRIDELGALLLQAVSQELRAAVERQFNEAESDEDPDAE